MKAQEIFNKVATHLFTQGKPSIAEGSISNCMYRGPNGSSCAVGCVLPDRYYKPGMEGNDVIGIIDAFTHPKWMAKNANLLSCLQLIHDDRYLLTNRGRFNKRELRKALTCAAKAFGLDYSILKSL